MKLKLLQLNFQLVILIILFTVAVSFGQKMINESVLINSQSEAEKSGYLWNKNSISNSIEIYRVTASKWLQIRNKPNAVFCFREASRLSKILGNDNDAMTYLKSALEISQTLENPEETIKVLSELSLFMLEKGKLKESKNYLDKANTLISRINSYSAKAISIYSNAEFNYYQRDLSETINLYIKAIEFSQKSNDLHLESIITLSLGYAYLFSGDYARGLKKLKTSLSISKELNDLRGIALANSAIGNAFAFLGEKQSALISYKTSELNFPNDLDFVEKARLFNGFAAIYQEFGEWKLSIEYYKKSLQLFTQANHKHGELVTLLQIGKLKHLLMSDITAIKDFNEAKTMALNLNDKLYLALINKELGNFFFSSGKYKKAYNYYLIAISLLKKNNSNREIAFVYNKLGELFLNQHNLKDSSKYLLKSLELNQEFKNKITLSETLYNLSKLDALKDNYTNALTSAKNSIEITETLTSDVLNSKLKTTYFSSVFDRYELYIKLLMKMQKQSPNENYAIEALQASEKSRARSMLENLALSEANFTKDADPELIKREKEIKTFLNLKSDKLTDALSNNVDKAEVDKLDGEINDLTNQLEGIKADLKQNSPIYSTIKNPAPFDVGDFQKNILDDNSLLLEFSFGKEESYLWCVGKNEVSSFTLPAREKLEERIQKLRELLSNHAMKTDESIENYQARINEADNNYWQEAQNLSNEIFGQISDKIGGKRLIIVADGKLHYFPISALPLPNSNKNEPLLLTNEVVYEPSALTLNFIKTSTNSKNPPSKNLLVFADPVFLKDDERLSKIEKPATNSNTDLAIVPTPNLRFAESLNQLQRLYASEEEAQTIAQIADSSKSNIFSGFSATREKLFTPEILDYKILHFATHGLINEDRPELSSIALSQYDEQAQPLEGLVRLQDIYSLNLSSDLVVLSACETGIGKEVKGEGLMSLNNAFLQVGAKSVLSSLWKVDDNATKELMKKFYQEMATEKFTTSEALRQAQIKMWNNPQFKSPFYWAAFTVQGDYQNTPKLARGLSYWIYILIGALILLIGIYAVYRINLQRKSK